MQKSMSYSSSVEPTTDRLIVLNMFMMFGAFSKTEFDLPGKKENWPGFITKDNYIILFYFILFHISWVFYDLPQGTQWGNCDFIFQVDHLSSFFLVFPLFAALSLVSLTIRYISVSLAISPSSLFLSVCLSVCPSNVLFFCPFVCLSFHLSVCSSVSRLVYAFRLIQSDKNLKASVIANTPKTQLVSTSPPFRCHT